MVNLQVTGDSTGEAFSKMNKHHSRKHTEESREL